MSKTMKTSPRKSTLRTTKTALNRQTRSGGQVTGRRAVVRGTAHRIRSDTELTKSPSASAASRRLTFSKISPQKADVVKRKTPVTRQVSVVTRKRQTATASVSQTATKKSSLQVQGTSPKPSASNRSVKKIHITKAVEEKKPVKSGTGGKTKTKANMELMPEIVDNVLVQNIGGNVEIENIAGPILPVGYKLIGDVSMKDEVSTPKRKVTDSSECIGPSPGQDSVQQLGTSEVPVAKKLKGSLAIKFKSYDWTKQDPNRWPEQEDSLVADDGEETTPQQQPTQPEAPVVVEQNNQKLVKCQQCLLYVPFEDYVHHEAESCEALQNPQGRDFTCSECLAAYPSQKLLVRHKRECPKRSQSMYRYQSPRDGGKQLEGMYSVVWKCHCKESFKSSEELSLHRMHCGHAQNYTVQCPICDMRIMGGQRVLRYHMSKDHPSLFLPDEVSSASILDSLQGAASPLNQVVTTQTSNINEFVKKLSEEHQNANIRVVTVPRKDAAASIVSLPDIKMSSPNAERPGDQPVPVATSTSQMMLSSPTVLQGPPNINIHIPSTASRTPVPVGKKDFPDKQPEKSPIVVKVVASKKSPPVTAQQEEDKNNENHDTSAQTSQVESDKKKGLRKRKHEEDVEAAAGDAKKPPPPSTSDKKPNQDGQTKPVTPTATRVSQRNKEKKEAAEKMAQSAQSTKAKDTQSPRATAVTSKKPAASAPRKRIFQTTVKEKKGGASSQTLHIVSLKTPTEVTKPTKDAASASKQAVVASPVARAERVVSLKTATEVTKPTKGTVSVGKQTVVASPVASAEPESNTTDSQDLRNLLEKARALTRELEQKLGTNSTPKDSASKTKEEPSKTGETSVPEQAADSDAQPKVTKETPTGKSQQAKGPGKVAKDAKTGGAKVSTPTIVYARKSTRKAIKCLDCLMVFKDHVQLGIHKRTNCTGGNIILDRTFSDTDIEALSQDSTPKVDSECYYCTLCPSKYGLRSLLHIHMRDEHDVGLHYYLNYHCPYCPRVFQTAKQRHTHKEQRHADLLKTPAEEEFGIHGIVACAVCHGVFQAQELDKHKAVCKTFEEEQPKYVSFCQLCGLVLDNEEDLKVHRQRNHLSAIHFRCGQCTRTFGHALELRCHKASHHSRSMKMEQVMQEVKKLEARKNVKMGKSIKIHISPARPAVEEPKKVAEKTKAKSTATKKEAKASEEVVKTPPTVPEVVKAPSSPVASSKPAVKVDTPKPAGKVVLPGANKNALALTREQMDRLARGQSVKLVIPKSTDMKQLSFTVSTKDGGMKKVALSPKHLQGDTGAVPQPQRVLAAALGLQPKDPAKPNVARLHRPTRLRSGKTIEPSSESVGSPTDEDPTDSAPTTSQEGDSKLVGDNETVTPEDQQPANPEGFESAKTEDLKPTKPADHNVGEESIKAEHQESFNAELQEAGNPEHQEPGVNPEEQKAAEPMEQELLKLEEPELASLGEQETVPQQLDVGASPAPTSPDNGSLTPVQVLRPISSTSVQCMRCNKVLNSMMEVANHQCQIVLQQ